MAQWRSYGQKRAPRQRGDRTNATALAINIDRPTKPLLEAGVAAIHEGAMRIFEEIGVEFLNTEALEILRHAGCSITCVWGVIL